MKLTRIIFIDGILNKGWLDNNGVLTIPEEYDEFEGLIFYLDSDIKNLIFNINGEQKKFMDAVKKIRVLGNVKDCSGLSFCDMNALEEFSIHGTFSELPKLMFSGTGIKILEISPNVRIIHMGSISDMPNLEKLVIPYMTKFEKDTNFKTKISFISDCPNLREIVLPEGAMSAEFVKYFLENENKNRSEAEKIKINYFKLKAKGPDEIVADLADYNAETNKILYDYLDKTKESDPDGINFEEKLGNEITRRFDYLKKANLDFSNPLSYYEYYADEVKAIKSCLKYMIDIKIRFAEKNKMSKEVVEALEDLKIQTDKADSLSLLKEIWFNITHVFNYFFNKEVFYKAKNTVRLKKLDEFINGNKSNILERPKTNNKSIKEQQHLPN